MASAKITLWGFQKYMEDNNDSLFKDLTLPDDIDKELACQVIMLKAGEFEVLYSDPLFLQQAITIWGNKWKDSFERWYNALHQTYSPIENYNRYEDSDDWNTSHGESDSTNKISAYNSSSLLDDSEGHGESDTEGHITHVAHLHGNIGVTTAAQMIQGELDIYTNVIYDMIADEFIKEFCLAVY